MRHEAKRSLLNFFATALAGCRDEAVERMVTVLSDGFAIYNIVLFGPFETAMRAYIIGRNSEMPLILLLMGMLGGLTIFGLLGLLIGPTLLAVGFALVYEWSAAPKPTATPVGELVEAPSH